MLSLSNFSQLWEEKSTRENFFEPLEIQNLFLPYSEGDPSFGISVKADNLRMKLEASSIVELIFRKWWWD